MLLVVEGERTSHARLVELVGSGDVALATGLEEARDRLERSSPAAMLLGVPMEEAADLVEAVRAGRFDRPGLPIVAVTDDERRAHELGVDETVPTSLEAEALLSAIERAVLLGQYKAAVNEFFDVCRERARGSRVDGRSRSARRSADAALEAIQARDDAIPIESLIDAD